MGNDRRLWWILAGASGVLAGLALPPAGLPWLLWPCLSLLWALAGSPHPAAAILWGMAAVLVSHRWLLWLHPLTWIGVPAPLSLPLCLLIWLACGLVGGLLVLGWCLLVRRLEGARPTTAVVMASLWGLAEVGLSRGPLFWIGLGSAALPGDPPLAAAASLIGAGGLAALQLLIGWCLWRALVGTPPQGAWPLRLRWWPLAVILLASHLLGPVVQAVAAKEQGPFEGVMVLQPAIPTRRKFSPDQQGLLLHRLAEAERRASELVSATTLVLPEGSLSLGQPLPAPASVEVLSGGFRLQGEEQRSSVLRFAPGDLQPSSWIDKHRVVPLGEWVPLARLWRWSGLSAVGGIAPGSPSRLLQRPAGPVAVAICYELSDGSALAAATRDGAGWLLASANLDPYPLMLQQQFTALARLRAIETGRWLVSAANTGPSLLVDERGRLLAQLPAGGTSTGLMTVARRTGLTPYDRWGEAPLLLALSGGLLGRWR